MARVMIIGCGPLPKAGLPYITASALRTRQFLKPILEAATHCAQRQHGLLPASGKEKTADPPLLGGPARIS